MFREAETMACHGRRRVNHPPGTHQLPAMLSVRLLARAEELHKKGSPLSGLEALRGVKGDLNNQVD